MLYSRVKTTKKNKEKKVRHASLAGDQVVELVCCVVKEAAALFEAQNGMRECFFLLLL